MSEKTGIKIYKESIKIRKESNRLSDQSIKDLKKLNKTLHDKIKSEYQRFLFKDLDANQDGFIDRKNSNLVKIGKLQNKIEDRLFTPYKSKYAKISRKLRKDQLRLRKEKSKIIKYS